MKKNISLLLGRCAIMILLTFFATAFSQVDEDESDEAPVLDYQVEIQKPVTKERQEKNKRFNNTGSLFSSGKTVITELPIGVEPLPTITHWWVGLPSLPVEQSTAVVIGEVVKAEAHLSDDRTAIYSDFSLGIEKVYKDSSDSISLSKPLSANRSGGSVRFASGRVNKYRIHRQGMPQTGKRYLLFLKRSEGGDFWILTGYKLSGGKVIPLDGEDNQNPSAALTFAKYRGTEELFLLENLRITLDDN